MMNNRESYRNLDFSAKPFRSHGERYDLYVRDKRSVHPSRFFATLRKTPSGTWDIVADDPEFCREAFQNIKTWLHKCGGKATINDVLFAVKYTYITYFCRDEVYVVGDEMELVDEAFLMGNQNDVEQALGIR